MVDDKLKFTNNILFMAEAAQPNEMDWNKRGFVFGTSYYGQTDREETPSKILSRIISNNNCIVSELRENIAFYKQFIVNDSGAVDRVVGYSHENAVNSFGIGGEGDAFFSDMNPDSYFNDYRKNNFSQLVSSPCLNSGAGLLDAKVFTDGVGVSRPVEKNNLFLFLPSIVRSAEKRF